MDITGQLNAAFPTFDALRTNLEQENAKIESREAEISEALKQERELSAQEQAEKSGKLMQYFDGLYESVIQRVPDEKHFNDYLGESRRSDEGKAVKEKFKQLQTLSKGHQVLIRLRDLQSKGEQLSRALADDSDAAIDIYEEMLEEEHGLQVFAKSSNPVVSALASKGVEQFQNAVRNPIQQKLSEDLRRILADAHWPKAAPSADQLIPVFTRLLRTEKVEEVTSSRPQPLKAFSILAEQYDLRFRFHFEGDKETNQLDKPEWAFEHFRGTIDEQIQFLESTIRDALSQVDRFSDRSPTTEFITAMLPSVYRLLEHTFPIVLDSHPDLISHLVYQTGIFDESLRKGEGSGYYYVPYGRGDDWRGVTGDILARSNYFERWLSVEREGAVKRYLEIEESKSAFEIDFESVDSGETKPTYSAINLKDLLEGITEHYRTLRGVNYRLRFLLDIQIDILDSYYSRLNDSLSIFDSYYASITRPIGMSAEEAKELTGFKGLERLCRVYGSAEYIVQALETWGQDLFFLTLWDDITKLRAKKKNLDSKVKNSIQEKKSSNIPQNEDDEGTLFDETIASYSTLKKRSMTTMSSILKKEMQSSLQTYTRQSDWRRSSDPVDISPELASALKPLIRDLQFLKSFHSSNDFYRITRTFSDDLAIHLWNHIVCSGSFSISGGKQLANDVSEVWLRLQLHPNKGLRKLEQACVVFCSEKTSKTHAQLKDELQLDRLTIDELETVCMRRA